MPRIEEYLPETEGQGPVGGLDPRTEAVGRVGAGLERVGQSVENAGQAVYRRQEQAEVSSTAADFSQMRTDYQQRLIQETQDGTLDVDKFKQDYQDDVNQSSEGIKTAGGRDYFNRLSARLGATLTIAAAHGQSQIAGAKAAADWQSEQNANANSLYQDPSSFSDIQAQSLEGIDARVQSGGLKAVQAEKLKTEAGANNAMASVRGWAQLGDTGRTNPDGTQIAGPDIAKHILDSGQLDQYLSPQQKEQAYGFVDHAAKAKVAADAQIDKQIKDQQKKDSDDWMIQNMAGYANNSLTPKQIMNSPLSGLEQMRLIDKIKENNTKKNRPDPQVITQMTDRMVLPDDDPNKIHNPQELLGKVPPADYTRIMGWYNKTPEGQALNANRKTMLDEAKSKILQKDPTDPMGNARVGYDRLAQFQVDLQAQEKEMVKQGKPIGSLYDPTSKDYFGNVLTTGKYQKSIQDLMADRATQMRANPPTKTNPPGADQSPPPMQRNLNESAQDFLKRKAKAGG